MLSNHLPVLGEVINNFLLYYLVAQEDCDGPHVEQLVDAAQATWVKDWCLAGGVGGD